MALGHREDTLICLCTIGQSTVRPTWYTYIGGVGQANSTAQYVSVLRTTCRIVSAGQAQSVSWSFVTTVGSPGKIAPPALAGGKTLEYAKLVVSKEKRQNVSSRFAVVTTCLTLTVHRINNSLNRQMVQGINVMLACQEGKTHH